MTTRTLAGLAMVALISAGCGSNPPSETVGVLAGAAATAAYAGSKSWAVVIPVEAWAGGIASAILIGAFRRSDAGRSSISDAADRGTANGMSGSASRSRGHLSGGALTTRTAVSVRLIAGAPVAVEAQLQDEASSAPATAPPGRSCVALG